MALKMKYGVQLLQIMAKYQMSTLGELEQEIFVLITKNKPEKRKIFIALGVVLGIVALCVAFYFIANAIVVDECGGVPEDCRNLKKPQPCAAVCEPLTLWESIFGE